MTRSFTDRLWEKIERRSSDECWPWTAGTNAYGYGRISRARKDGPILAHRAVYECAFDIKCGDKHVLHSCDNPRCCNPHHLTLGTPADNMADKTAKGRHHGAKITHCPRGHEYTPDNIYMTRKNGRICRICALKRSADANSLKRRNP